MTADAICALRVDQVAAESCHLWLWSTNGSLPAAHDVIDAWGFRYISVLTWIKPRLGLGNYLRNSSEQLLFAVRGTSPMLYRGIGQRSHCAIGTHLHHR